VLGFHLILAVERALDTLTVWFLNFILGLSAARFRHGQKDQSQESQQAEAGKGKARLFTGRACRGRKGNGIDICPRRQNKD
jgi:hypothetical protein